MPDSPVIGKLTSNVAPTLSLNICVTPNLPVKKVVSDLPKSWKKLGVKVRKVTSDKANETGISILIPKISGSEPVAKP